MHEQPRRIAAGAGRFGQRFLRSLHARFHADQVGDAGVNRLIQFDEEVNGSHFFAANAVDDLLQGITGGQRFQVGSEFAFLRLAVTEGELFALRFNEEVEGIDRRQLGDKIDGNAQMIRWIGEDDAGIVVAVGVLLPVEELLFRFNMQGVAEGSWSACARRGVGGSCAD